MPNVRLTLVDKSLRILWSNSLPNADDRFIGHSILEFIAEDDHATVREKLTQILLDTPTTSFRVLANVHDPPNYDPRASAVQITMYRIDGVPVVAALLAVVETSDGEVRAQDREILRLLADDYDLGQIAEELGRSKSTVEHRVGKLKSRLGLKTLPGLAAEAVRRGLAKLDTVGLYAILALSFF